MLKKNSITLNKFSLLLNYPLINVFISGLLANLCFCKGYTYPVLVIPMFYVLLSALQKCKNQKYRNPFLLGFAFGFGYFGSTLFWVVEAFKCVGFGVYGYVAVLLLVIYLSIFPATACTLSTRFSKTETDFSILFSIFWTICEYIRGWLFTGFPWNLIGYVTYDIPYFSQIADIFGVYGVSFFFLLSICFSINKKTVFYGLGIFCIIISYGIYKIELYGDYIIPSKTDNISIIQPSISQEDKMNREKIRECIARHLEISNLNAAEKRLIVWPEAAIGIPLDAQYEIGPFIDRDDVFVLTGTDRFTQDRKLFNSLKIIGKNSKILQIYDKRHLLPFGEFIPEWLLDFGLRKVVPSIINYLPGERTRTISLPGFNQFDVIICYEIVFPGEIIDNQGSSWILNITNDAWFKDSDGPSQHLRTTCFRAIEEGKAIARCANNGISCIIDCNGRVIKNLETNAIGKIEHAMPMKYQNTIFSRYKNGTILTVLLMLLLVAILNSKREQCNDR
ncbi:MAG: apolipoprotein N-acyltransferase [Holosporales bacterium]|jgi:apolipoprotein N-acyltransferase|nr:apolipoprotein N-acyltransferase [Holosporales bacterium]